MQHHRLSFQRHASCNGSVNLLLFPSVVMSPLQISFPLQEWCLGFKTTLANLVQESTGRLVTTTCCILHPPALCRAVSSFPAATVFPGDSVYMWLLATAYITWGRCVCVGVGVSASAACYPQQLLLPGWTHRRPLRSFCPTTHEACLYKCFHFFFLLFLPLRST